MRSPTKLLLSLTLVLCGWSSSAGAQPLGDPIDKAREVRDKALSESSDGSVTAPVEGAPETKADPTPLGVDFKQLVLVPKQEAVSSEAGMETGGWLVVDETINLPTGLQADLETNYADAPVSLALLEELVKAMITAWRATDYPLVDIYLAPQNITEGKIQLVVREAVLGEVKVEGAEYAAPEFLTRQIQVDKGQRINSRRVEDDLDWLNEHPSRRVDLIYERGEEDGTSDLVLKTEEMRPFQVYGGFANSGLESTGTNEWAMGLNWSRAFGTEQIIGYNYQTDMDWENLQSHTAIWQIPFERTRHTLTLLGAWVMSESSAKGGLFPIDIDGESRQLTADYKIPLDTIRLPDLKIRARHSIHLATDYKSTNTDIIFGGESFFDTTAEVVQFRLGYEMEAADDFGYTRVDLAINYAPGNVLAHNGDDDFSSLREGASADYIYGTAGIERLQELPADWTLRADLETQFTDSRLLSTEQLLAGGYRTVRGFDENFTRGDGGALLTLELGPPPVSVFKKDRLSPFVFYDAAWLYVSDSRAGEASPSIQSTGIGLNWRLGAKAFARAAYGWNVGDSGVFDANDGKLHFGVTMTY